jgi:hypothetical protein
MLRARPRMRRTVGRPRPQAAGAEPASATICRFPAISRFASSWRIQIAQTDFDHIEIRYVPRDGGRQPDVPALTQQVRKVLHQRPRPSSAGAFAQRVGEPFLTQARNNSRPSPCSSSLDE